MHEARWSLHDGSDGERRGAAARGVDCDESVLRIERGVARAVDDGRRHALEHVLNVTLLIANGKSEQKGAVLLVQEERFTPGRRLFLSRPPRCPRTRAGAWPACEKSARLRLVLSMFQGASVPDPRRVACGRPRPGANAVAQVSCIWPHSWASRTHLGAGQPARHAGQLVTAPANECVVVTG